MNAATETILQPAAASTPDGMMAMLTCGQARLIFLEASMADLVTLGRMFWAAINSRHSPDEPYDEELSAKSDDEMNVLATFDDEISIRIVERAPRDADERALKASYLIARIRSNNMSEEAEGLAQQWVEDAAMGLV